MNKYKCQRGKSSGCITCKYGGTGLKREPCRSCRGKGHFPNCPMVLSISYDYDRPACDGCKWEAREDEL